MPPEMFTKYDKYFGRFGAIWVGVCLLCRAVSNTRGELKKKCDFFSMQFPANLSDDQRAIQALLVISEIEIIIEREGKCCYPSECYENFKIVHIFQAISDKLEVKSSNEYSKI